jgi:hypothetical protein
LISTYLSSPSGTLMPPRLSAFERAVASSDCALLKDPRVAREDPEDPEDAGDAAR